MTVRNIPLACAAFLFSSTAALAAPELHIADAVSLTRPVPIRVTGIAPGTDIVIRAERPSPYKDGRIFRSEMAYRADRRGIVDTAEPAPVSIDPQRSDVAVDPFAPFWQMQRTEEPAEAGWDDNEVRLTIDLDGDALPDMSGSVRVGPDASDSVEAALTHDFPGAFVARPAGSANRKLPLVIVLGGSEGGDGAARSMTPAFIEQGYAVLGLPYHSPKYYGRESQFPELPSSFAELPVDYVEAVLEAVRGREGIDGTRIALWGASKGAELALLTASYRKDICAVVAIVPSDIVWEGWGPAAIEGETSGFSYRGQALPFVPYVGMGAIIAKLARGERVDLRPAMDAGRSAFADRVEAARIRVENIGAPVFLVGGGRDGVWASADMAQNIARRRKSQNLPTTLLTFPEASHSLSWSPFHPGQAADARARAEAFPAMIKFLAEAFSPQGCVSR